MNRSIVMVFSLSKEKRPKWAPFLGTKKAAEGGLGIRYEVVIPEVNTGLKRLGSSSWNLYVAQQTGYGD